MGGTSAGTFCALTSLISQLEAEGSLDIFQTARLTNQTRPGVFSHIVSSDRRLTAASSSSSYLTIASGLEKLAPNRLAPRPLSKHTDLTLQEQYQFLYRAMLSLVGMQEDQEAFGSSDTNGTIVVGSARPAESLESLV